MYNQKYRHTLEKKKPSKTFAMALFSEFIEFSSTIQGNRISIMHLAALHCFVVEVQSLVVYPCGHAGISHRNSLLTVPRLLF